jgi:hypothetical protein
MKKDNKKALYESIMTAVAKEVKKVLNESSMSNLSRLQRKFVQAVMSNEEFELPNGHIIDLYELGDYGCGRRGLEKFLLEYGGGIEDGISEVMYEYFYGFFVNGDDDESVQEALNCSDLDISLEDFKLIYKLASNPNVQRVLQIKIDRKLNCDDY